MPTASHLSCGATRSNKAMAKVKGQPGVQNRIIYSRASYLYQAANYLSNCVGSSENASTPAGIPCKAGHSVHPQQNKQQESMEKLSRMVITDMRAVSLKAQIRQSPALKRTVCKFCDTLLVEGRSCSSTVENSSKGGRKPWADVLVIECKTCGNVKRFPVDAPRQKRKCLRSVESNSQESEKRESTDEVKDNARRACLVSNYTQAPTAIENKRP